jgi:hypothetical protein
MSHESVISKIRSLKVEGGSGWGMGGAAVFPRPLFTNPAGRSNKTQAGTTWIRIPRIFGSFKSNGGGKPGGGVLPKIFFKFPMFPHALFGAA